MKLNWEKLFEYAIESELENALYYTLYHCQLIFGNIIPNDIYVTWDMQKVKEISNTIMTDGLPGTPYSCGKMDD